MIFSCVFDIPYLRGKRSGLAIAQPHMDLCFAVRRLGLAGGLKQLERQAGIERPLAQRYQPSPPAFAL